ncbi:hypothetical protein EDB81DRAFT_807674 [Dactylonectria macrodidyma]|uniref:C2H2-type domain-containing protein n=1 Tax=Dactylonectria macrodidyma TaxID=307937 RepID=A0A9P9ITV6_9HYPO|nr:hypothetical protein EDB81DRAFT_807674 [Dactylonectria macrodidyma]
MKLPHVNTGQVVDCPDTELPSYAILSHTWLADAEARQAISKDGSISTIPYRPREGHAVSASQSQSDETDDAAVEYCPFYLFEPYDYLTRPWGTKRSRSGKPITGVKSHQRRGTTFPVEILDGEDDGVSSSESELDDGSSSSDGDSEEDIFNKDDRSLCDDVIVGECNSDTDHDFQSMRAGMRESLYDKIQARLASARYDAPPDNRPPPRKRARTTDWKSQSGYLEEEDQDDPELVVVSRVDGYFHLACPFYVSNPTRYQKCLLQHDLQSVEDVIHHIRKHHTQPPYCPMCRQTFDRAVDRDNHARARTCELRSPKVIDGVSAYQKAQLLRGDKLHLGVTKRWQRVWATVFPKTELCRSPYLEDGVELMVTMVRDHWGLHGRDYIEQYLARHSLVRRKQGGESSAEAAIHRLMLQDLLSMAFENA